ncbi:class I SAM-dependent methyltransferase [Candidatus Enterococcus clewellii]|uniref:Methyltransferase domain-containing protein n=1 Tax=Candidatus Enterococcus clewellii TaxID=1834193 RepID=A0A242JZ94_9ENTE|nr:class I SAM-dependent methyltransferase [Enterococcus sp. 9E7_DIV0242]OTP10542.1 hypothetical protein A5888_003840 [Enterococcus sp. 9E7_DIV0242]
MKIIIYLGLIVLLLWGLFRYLLQQSKQPTGIVGGYMMKLWNKVYLPMVEWSLAYIPEYEIKKILDVGVGNGQSTKRLAQKFPHAHIYGIDISEKAIEQAKKMNANTKITFERKDVVETSYPADYFELICVYQNHFHWSDLDKSLAELKRVLATEGTIIIACEISKANYYLPDFKKEENFAIYLHSVGLSLIQMKKTTNWVLYELKKLHK